MYNFMYNFTCAIKM